MHPDRVIVSMYRLSDGISTRPDNQNIRTLQSANTNDASRDPLLGPVAWNPVRTRPYSTLRLRLRLRLRSRVSPPPSRFPQALHRCVKIPPIVASVIWLYQHHRHPQFHAISRFCLDSTKLFFDLIDLIRLNFFQFD